MTVISFLFDLVKLKYVSIYDDITVYKHICEKQLQLISLIVLLAERNESVYTKMHQEPNVYFVHFWPG